MEGTDSGEDAPREVVRTAGLEEHAGTSATSASGTTTDGSTNGELAAGGDDAGNEAEGEPDAEQPVARKNPVIENLDRLLKERREARTRGKILRKEIKTAQKQKARIKKNATRLTDEDLLAVIKTRGINVAAAENTA